jgi:hypothetical protein
MNFIQIPTGPYFLTTITVLDDPSFWQLDMKDIIQLIRALENTKKWKIISKEVDARTIVSSSEFWPQPLDLYVFHQQDQLLLSQ